MHQSEIFYSFFALKLLKDENSQLKFGKSKNICALLDLTCQTRIGLEFDLES